MYRRVMFLIGAIGLLSVSFSLKKKFFLVIFVFPRRHERLTAAGYVGFGVSVRVRRRHVCVRVRRREGQFEVLFVARNAAFGGVLLFVWRSQDVQHP